MGNLKHQILREVHGILGFASGNELLQVANAPGTSEHIRAALTALAKELDGSPAKKGGAAAAATRVVAAPVAPVAAAPAAVAVPAAHAAPVSSPKLDPRLKEIYNLLEGSKALAKKADIRAFAASYGLAVDLKERDDRQASARQLGRVIFGLAEEKARDLLTTIKSLKLSVATATDVAGEELKKLYALVAKIGKKIEKSDLVAFAMKHKLGSSIRAKDEKSATERKLARAIAAETKRKGTLLAALDKLPQTVALAKTTVKPAAKSVAEPVAKPVEKSVERGGAKAKASTKKAKPALSESAPKTKKEPLKKAGSSASVKKSSAIDAAREFARVTKIVVKSAKMKTKADVAAFARKFKVNANIRDRDGLLQSQRKLAHALMSSPRQQLLISKL